MRQLFLAGSSLLAVSACGPQPAPPTAAAGTGDQPIMPRSYAAGSPSYTTTAFDGRYAGVAIRNISKGNTLGIVGGTATLKCPDYGVPPTLTIANGLAQFEALNLTFQGYVTPQGTLKMDSGYGQTLEGQIDHRYALNAQVLGSCAYDASWRKS